MFSVTKGLATARAAKASLELFLIAGTIMWVLLTGYLLPSSGLMGVPDSRADVAVAVAIGDRTFAPIVRFESPTPGVVSQPALAGGIAQLRFETTSRLLSFVSTASILAAIALLLYIAWVLRRILLAVIDGRPFDPANGRGLRMLAFLLIVGAFAAPLTEYLLARWVLGSIEVEGIALSPPFRMSLTPILAGLLLYVLSTIFQHGAELEEDRSLTI